MKANMATHLKSILTHSEGEVYANQRGDQAGKRSHDQGDSMAVVQVPKVAKHTANSITTL